jgi:F-type H+-transporting ATPase subunit gamma
VPGIADAEAIAEPAIADFTAGKVDSVYLVYNEFKSVIQQQLRTKRLLPLAQVGESAAAAAASQGEYIYEPSPQEIFDTLLHRIVEVEILHALLESAAGFYAAQMTAMDAATRNSAEMIEGLTLTMNKVRQAAITREIIEVVSGAQALE